ncbi:putative N-acetylmannosamine-6-phosphate 2-epimerase [Actinomadura sp. CNU-125]|uniref:putative N-acetylmannosamine-6-phosphate 2-epimerase n=1 Tax=Actinomadura sp. CNU-125 TaxID=1904961 RepID=UPI000A7CE5AF|nr:putative N-acetylmannosamine-6-phosphate 2-epimerase [Actinomadura sp. CNU-125]
MTRARYAALDIGGTKIAAALTDEDGTVLHRARVPTPRDGGPSVLATAARLLDDLAGRGLLELGIRGVGVGAPGVVDAATGRVVSATGVLPGWAGTAVREVLAERTGLPVAVANDVRVMGLGEALRGAGAGFGRVLHVSVGTGVGGALTTGGRLDRGAHGTAGELAHLLVPERGPVPSGCGRRDHLEAAVSGPAIAATGDPGRAGALLGRALAGVLAVLDPDASCSAAASRCAARRSSTRSPPRSARRRCRRCATPRSCPARLGTDAGSVGAALLARTRKEAPDDVRGVRRARPRPADRVLPGRARAPAARHRRAHPVGARRRGGRGGGGPLRGVGGVADVAAIAAAVAVPVIGLTKDGTDGVFITPTVEAARAVVAAGAAVVAADATSRPRPDGRTVADSVAAVHDAGALFMADVATLAEGVAAAGAGADIVATTLAGYTGPGPVPDGPDIDLVRALRAALPDATIIAEGRYHSPEAAAAAIAAGATSVVVGTAITDPQWITARFAAAVASA